MSVGAQRVGWIDDLGHVERFAVRWLRHWERDPSGQAQLQEALATGFGEARARNVTAVFADLMELAHVYGRRKLCRHACHCQCLGADEAIFAHLVETAANGDAEDAAMLAALMVRPDMAMCFAGLAAEFGMAMAALARSLPARPSRPSAQNASRSDSPAKQMMSRMLH
ncbi:hypothetical protein [Shimia marina]|uniref:Uncharacterized protein n=1 Tax=Shimia marina TaxID=321267 RepID=A0A0P1EQ46_9RHOB|nr:hypothetical protein [Shimia marina]CUH52258.1 hypothetical protein SHM7688_01704 [Shimia marina]SFE06992.1 hypothetical protein SAMN04488037_10528 [Shimia marina]